MARSRRTCCSCARECIFCGIVKQAGSPGSRVLYQDDAVVVLPDIRPAAAVHLLVLPRTHVPNVSSLAGPDVALVRHMVAVGEQLLQQEDQKQPGLQPAVHKFGFHKPPFRSVDHLHLHCFTLPLKWYRWIQYQSDINWITAEDLVDKLSRMPSDKFAAVSQAGNAQTPAAAVASDIEQVAAAATAAPGVEATAAAAPNTAGVVSRPTVAVVQELAARQAQQGGCSH